MSHDSRRQEKILGDAGKKEYQHPSSLVLSQIYQKNSNLPSRNIPLALSHVRVACEQILMKEYKYPFMPLSPPTLDNEMVYLPFPFLHQANTENISLLVIGHYQLQCVPWSEEGSRSHLTCSTFCPSPFTTF